MMNFKLSSINRAATALALWVLLNLLLPWAAMGEGAQFVFPPFAQWEEPTDWNGNIPDSYELILVSPNAGPEVLPSIPYSGGVQQSRLEHLPLGQYSLAVRAIGLKNGESIKSKLSSFVLFMMVSEPIGEGLTMLTAQHSGLPMEMRGASELIGDDLRQGEATGGEHQAFQLLEVQPGIFTLIVQHTKLCIGIQGQSTQNGARAQQQACDGSTSQQFSISSSPSQIRNVNSQKCLDVPGSITEPGVFIQQYSCHGESNQQFTWSVQGKPLPAITGITFQ